MGTSMRKMLSIACVVSAAVVLSTPAARATVSVAGGGWVGTSPSQSGGAVMLSTGQALPVVPIGIQGTLLIPITKQGGWAATAEIRGLSGGGFGGAYVGAGAGVGDLAIGQRYGPVVTIFGGKAIAPRTSVELRLYQGLQKGGSTAGFLGFRFSL
jgi:hypothetical protein